MLKIEFFDFIISLIDKNKHPVEYKNPDLTILLEISNDLLCFTVLEKYYQYRLYNLLALCKSDEELREEKEKLMYLQNTAHERKAKTETEKAKEINIGDELKKVNNEKHHEHNLSLNEGNNEEENDGDDDKQSDVDLI